MDSFYTLLLSIPINRSPALLAGAVVCADYISVAELDTYCPQIMSWIWH